MIWVVFSIWLLSRVFSVFMHIVTSVSTSFTFYIVIKSIEHNIYQLHHLKYSSMTFTTFSLFKCPHHPSPILLHFFQVKPHPLNINSL